MKRVEGRGYYVSSHFIFLTFAFFAVSRMAKEAADNDVQELNRRAALIMSSAKIPTIDLHSAVVSKCGPVPQASCFGAANCFSPHCVQAGYDWLANSTIVPAIRALL